MSLHAPATYIIPEETIRVAKAVLPHGNRYIKIVDTLGPLFSNTDFQHLFSREGRPAEAPARLALVTVMQFVEGLSDRQAAEAVRVRIDWKYVLVLPLEAPGFDASVLCEFRSRLLDHGAELLVFEQVLDALRGHGLLRTRGRQRSDSTHVLAAVRALNRLACVGVSMRHALNSLAVAAPDWIMKHSTPEWLDRYGSRFDHERFPRSKADRQELAEVIGQVG